MYTMIQERVLNSLIDSSGKSIVTGTPEWLTILRDNTYDVSKILGKKITKAAYVAPAIAKAELTLPGAPVAGEYMLVINLGLRGVYEGSYMNASTYTNKPIMLGFNVADGDTTEDVALALTKLINKWAVSNQMIEASVVTPGSGIVTITGTDKYQYFNSIYVQKVTGDMIAMDGTYKAVSTEKGNQGFGTSEFIMKNYRLPTMENRRFTALHEDEQPIDGATYNQYMFSYAVERDGIGSGAVGQVVTSLTTHVYWVNTAVAAEFEKQLEFTGAFS